MVEQLLFLLRRRRGVGGGGRGWRVDISLRTLTIVKMINLMI